MDSAASPIEEERQDENTRNARQAPGSQVNSWANLGRSVSERFTLLGEFQPFFARWRRGFPCVSLAVNQVEVMTARDIAEAVLGLPQDERLELARRIVADVVAEQRSADEIAQAVLGMEEVIKGKVKGMTEDEFRKALQ
ncbi:MAG: hypothetical protein ACLQVY_05530 [Limisphaerales bacterium]